MIDKIKDDFSTCFPPIFTLIAELFTSHDPIGRRLLYCARQSQAVCHLTSFSEIQKLSSTWPSFSVSVLKCAVSRAWFFCSLSLMGGVYVAEKVASEFGLWQENGQWRDYFPVPARQLRQSVSQCRGSLPGWGAGVCQVAVLVLVQLVLSSIMLLCFVYHALLSAVVHLGQLWQVTFVK